MQTYVTEEGYLYV